MKQKRTMLMTGLLSLLLLGILGTIPVQAMSVQPVRQTRESISYGSGTANFTAIRVDMSHPRIQVVSALPNNKIGQTQSLAALIAGQTDEDGTGVAGINGTFFMAYSDMQPTGTVIMNGDVLHVSNAGSLIGIDGDNNVLVDAVYTNILGGTMNQWEWPYNWYAWNINHWYPDPLATMLFDSHYDGPKPLHDFGSVEVTNGVVTRVGTGSFRIPTDGFLLLTKDATILSKFKTGTPAEFDMALLDNSYGVIPASQQAPIAWNQVKSALGAGPILVKSGVVVVDPVMERFTEPKILETKAQRSFAGVTSGRELVFASVPSVTVTELAKVASMMGLTDAINLDGGGSSTTWMADMTRVMGDGTLAAGAYVSPPGRNISNALVVRLMNDEPVRVRLNGTELFFDSDPYLNKQYQRVLVPLRKIAEALGARVTWDGATSAIVVTKGDTVAHLRANDRRAVLNGKTMALELPVIVRNSRSYVPARFLAELLGAGVDWDGPTRTVVLTQRNHLALIEQAQAKLDEGQYKQAATLLEQVLVEEPDNLTLMKKLASVYYTNLKQYSDAARWYKMILVLEPGNTTIMTSLSWALYSIPDYTETVRYIRAELVNTGKAASVHYLILGHVYASYSMRDVEEARKWYTLVLQSDPSESHRTQAEKWLNAN